LTVAGAKATGVSLRRDIHAMEDAGAKDCAIFTDFGCATTTASNAADLTREMLTELASKRPDLIVLELGDGLLGPYGVDAILASKDIRDTFGAVVLAAGGPVRAWGGERHLHETYGIQTTVITGPATDNLASTEIIDNFVHVASANAVHSRGKLTSIVLDALSVQSSNKLVTQT